MCRHWLIPSSIAFLVLTGVAFAGNPTAKITPDLLIHPNSVLQPFAGTARFAKKPTLSKPCTVEVKVKCLHRVDSPERIRLEAGGAYGLVFSPDSVVWNAPIDSGATLTAQFTFQPEDVGTYQFYVTRRLDTRWQPLTSLTLAFSEDGKTKYAGSTVGYHLNSIPPHPQRNALPLTLRFPLRGNVFDPQLDHDFTGELRFSGPPTINDTITVDFALACHAEQYTGVQFILDYSANLKVSELSPSWGEEVHLTDSSRFHRGRFWFVPLDSGIGVLKLRVVGKRPLFGRLDRVTTEFPVYFVTGSDGKLLLIGSFEPWTRYKKKKDPMLGGLKRLVEVTKRDYRLKQVLSIPDYKGEELGTPISGRKTGGK